MIGWEKRECQGLQRLEVGVGLRLGSINLARPSLMTSLGLSEYSPCPEPTLEEELFILLASVAEHLSQALGAMNMEMIQT